MCHLFLTSTSIFIHIISIKESQNISIERKRQHENNVEKFMVSNHHQRIQIAYVTSTINCNYSNKVAKSINIWKFLVWHLMHTSWNGRASLIWLKRSSVIIWMANWIKRWYSLVMQKFSSIKRRVCFSQATLRKWLERYADVVYANVKQKLERVSIKVVFT